MSGVTVGVVKARQVHIQYHWLCSLHKAIVYETEGGERLGWESIGVKPWPRGPTSGLKFVPAVCVLCRGHAESQPIDKSKLGKARPGVEWRSPAKAETVSLLWRIWRRLMGSLLLGLRGHLHAHWSRGHEQTTANHVAQSRLSSRYTKLFYRRVCDASANQAAVFRRGDGPTDGEGVGVIAGFTAGHFDIVWTSCVAAGGMPYA
jgi:hypothetical protein